MLAYVTIGTNDMEKATAFYDKIFEAMGANRMMQNEKLTAYGRDMNSPMVIVTHPYNENPATAGNGSMLALACKDPSQVDDVHKLAISLGAVNEGDAGPRGEQFYCGYFRDPDGNKLNLFCFQQG